VRGGVAAAIAAGLLATSGAASAYVRTTTQEGAALRWPTNCITLNVHDADPPPNLTPDLFLTAARNAAMSWSHPNGSCTNLQLTIVAVNDSSAPVDKDSKNNVMFRRDQWCKDPRSPDEPCYDPNALAITTVFAEQHSGLIVDVDIEINGKNFVWGDLVARIGTGGNAQDIQNTLTHEFGHVIGLDHNCYLPMSGQSKRPVDDMGQPVPDCSAASAEMRLATMFAAVIKGDVQRRTLSPDDIRGVCAVYPASNGPGCIDSGGGSGGCDCAIGRRGRQAPAGWALVVATLLLSRGARRRLRRRA
jgi:hypothetical protein